MQLLSITSLLEQHISDREIADANLKATDNWAAQVSLLRKCVNTMAHLHLKTSASNNIHTEALEHNGTDVHLYNGAAALKNDDVVVSISVWAP